MNMGSNFAEIERFEWKSSLDASLTLRKRATNLVIVSFYSACSQLTYLRPQSISINKSPNSKWVFNAERNNL